MAEIAEKPQARSPVDVVKGWGERGLIGILRRPGKVPQILPPPQRADLSAKNEHVQFRVTVIRLQKQGFCKLKNVMMDIDHEVSIPLLLEAVKIGKTEWVTLRLVKAHKPVVKVLSAERDSLKEVLRELGYMKKD